MNWQTFKSLHEIYKNGKTKFRPTLVGDPVFKFHINQTKELLVTKKEILVSPSRSGNSLNFENTFKKNYLDQFTICFSFLEEKGLNTPYCKFEMEDILILRDMQAQMNEGLLSEIREQIIKSNETRRGVSLMFFKHEKHLDNHEALEKAVKQILNVEIFTDERDFQYLYVLQCRAPKAIVLCENLHFLKMPGKPRENDIELWYAGGRNIEKLRYSNHGGMPIYYCCDWDYDGLDIFHAVKEKIPEIVLLLPNGIPREIEKTEHKSLWEKREDANYLSGLQSDLFSESQRLLIRNLIKNNLWVVEESNDLIEMIKSIQQAEKG